MFAQNLNSVLDRLMTVSQAVDDAAIRSAAAGPDGRLRGQFWLPPVDLYETETAFVVTADLPGVAQEHVNVHFDRTTLTITGERPATLPSREQKGQVRVFSAERRSGSFSRSIRLPEHVDPENISAAFDSGVLTVTIPKASKALPKKIVITTTPVPASLSS